MPGFYERLILPRLIHASMRQMRLDAYRRRAVSSAEGRVLEIGIGSGLNLKPMTYMYEGIARPDPGRQRR